MCCSASAGRSVPTDCRVRSLAGTARSYATHLYPPYASIATRMDVMNKFPDDFDESVFVGRTLELICFAAYQVMFHFDDRILISALSTFTFQKPTENLARKIPIPVTQSDLMPLLEHRVSRTSLEEQHILTLMFDSGHVLRFYDDTSGVYESYHLSIGDRTIII